jgi:hypothetical protein
MPVIPILLEPTPGDSTLGIEDGATEKYWLILSAAIEFSGVITKNRIIVHINVTRAIAGILDRK